MIPALPLLLALAAAPQVNVSASAHAGSGSMTSPPASNAPPSAGGGTGSAQSLIYHVIHIGGFGKGTKTGYWEEAMIYAPDQSKPRPLLVIFHKYGVGYLDGWVNTNFFQHGRRRGWHVVCMLGASGVNFASPESQQNTETVIDWMLANYNIDKARIYGVGFSMGGGSATSYAARHLDPSKAMFAALVDHTGGVALTDLYLNEMAPSWPLPQLALDFWYGDGTQGSADPWRMKRSSVIDFDPQTLLVDPTTDMARNLAHVPTYVTRASQEPPLTAYLTAQTDVFAAHLASRGGSVKLAVVPYSGHSWDMLDERKAMRWLGRKRLKMPKSASTLADRDGVFFHFTVQQTAPEVFTPFEWSLDSTGNSVTIIETANLARIAVDLAGAGLSASAPLTAVLGSADGLPYQAVLTGWPSPPSSVTLGGVPTGAWSHDPAAQELQLNVPGIGPESWVVTP